MGLYEHVSWELMDLGIRITSVVPDYDKYKDESPYYQHQHSNYELHYAEKGSCELYCEGQYYPIEQGQFCLFGPGLYHSQKAESEDFNKICFAFDLDGTAGKNPTRDRLEKIFWQRRVLVCGGPELVQLMKLLRQELTLRQVFEVDALKGLLRLAVLQIARYASNEEGEEVPEKRGLDEIRVDLIDVFFNDHFNLSAGEEVLAERLGVSRRQLNRILQRLYGKSFREKMLEVRTEVAIDMLLNSSRSIQEISELVGYSTPANFSAFFKNAVGMTPSRMRERGRKGK